MKMRLWMLPVMLFAAAECSAYDFIEFQKPIGAQDAKWGVSVAASPSRYYLGDTKKRTLFIFDENGSLVKTVDRDTVGAPAGIAIGPDGEIFVADSRNARIQVLSPDGKLLRSIGRKGSAPGSLNKPQGVAVGADGRIFVADTGNDRVQVFTQEGIFLFGFGTGGKEAGQFDEPTQIAVDPSDDIYVLDLGNERVQKFDPSTKHVRDFTLHGSAFTVDDYGFIYMVDAKRGKVKELGPDGMVLGGFGSAGKGKGQFRKPKGIAVAPDGTLIIADSGNRRLQRVRLDNKLKVSRLKPNLATKLVVTGPEKTLPIAATVLGAGPDQLYAYVEDLGQFAVYDKDGKELLRFGARKGKGEEITEGAGGVAYNAKFGIYVADLKGDKIQNFDAKGRHRSNFAEAKGFFASTSKEGRVSEPHGVSATEKSLYVADTGNKRVDNFSPDGSFLFGFGPLVGPHELDEPVDVAWDPAGYVYVLDRGLKKVIKCQPSGGFIKAWGEYGEGVGQFKDPVAIAYDGRSYLYVLDRGQQRVSVFDRDGNWVTNFFSGGSDERSLGSPVDLAVLGSELYISDEDRGKVVGFSLHPRLAPPVRVSTSAVEGEVVLQWEAVKDPWVEKYRVSRSSKPYGPFVEIGKSDASSFSDSAVEAYKKYYYRVSVEAATGDRGPWSRAVEVYIPGAFNVSPIEISTVTIGSIFPANYKWYLTNPVGRITVKSNVNVPFRNVKVAFRLKDFMDFDTEETISRLNPKGEVELPLKATLNNKILGVTEDTPIQGMVKITYHEKGEKKEVTKALPLRVYSRNAIRWDDIRRISAFITPNDPPVKQLSRDILNEVPDGPDSTEYLNDNLVKAMELWAGLSSGGIKFFAAPNNPFEKMSEDPTFPVDYTQFPRETLKLKSGECDDLVTLIASLLEHASIKTALLDYPGHLALMFDTEARSLEEIGLPEEKLVKYKDTYWLPVEATMIGSPFEDAVAKGLVTYNEMNKDGRVRITDPRRAWATYEPATLPKPEQEDLKPDMADYKKRFSSTAGHYVKARYQFLKGFLEDLIKAEPDDELQYKVLLGILEGQYGKHPESEKMFKEVLAAEPENAAALNNLGTLEYIQGKYEAALKTYGNAAKADPEDPGIWMNMARTSVKMGKKNWAEDYGKKAASLDPELKADMESLLKL